MALPETPARPVPANAEAYCVKCKATRPVIEGQIVTVKNGKQALKGKCPVCGTTMMKFLSSKQAQAVAVPEAGSGTGTTG
jgi:hypothetical protein